MIKTNEFKDRLQAEKARLERMIASRQASAKDHDRLSLNESFSNSGDDEYADTATDTYTQELDMTMLNKYRNHLTNVNEALGRIESGTYGKCIRCQTEISNGRLDAIPETPYCRDCEADVEAQD
ncbi:MAG: TraR/DksA family transcriptional regulator [Candidatus Sericytochromatia bacterium]